MYTEYILKSAIGFGTSIKTTARVLFDLDCRVENTCGGCGRETSRERYANLSSKGEK